MFKIVMLEVSSDRPHRALAIMASREPSKYVKGVAAFMTIAANGLICATYKIGDERAKVYVKAVGKPLQLLD